jgi:hypothetical protein
MAAWQWRPIAIDLLYTCHVSTLQARNPEERQIQGLRLSHIGISARLQMPLI